VLKPPFIMYYFTFILRKFKSALEAEGFDVEVPQRPVFAVLQTRLSRDAISRRSTKSACSLALQPCRRTFITRAPSALPAALRITTIQEKSGCGNAVLVPCNLVIHAAFKYRHFSAVSTSARYVLRTAAFDRLPASHLSQWKHCCH